MNFPKSAEVHADCFGFREFKAVSIHPVINDVVYHQTEVECPRRNRRAPRRFLDYELTSSAAVSFCPQERTLMQRPTPTAGYRCRCCTDRFSTLEGQHAHERWVHPGLDDLINATVAVVSERPEETEEPLPLRQMSTRGCPVHPVGQQPHACCERYGRARPPNLTRALGPRNRDCSGGLRPRRKDSGELASDAGGATAVPDRRGGHSCTRPASLVSFAN